MPDAQKPPNGWRAITLELAKASIIGAAVALLTTIVNARLLEHKVSAIERDLGDMRRALEAHQGKSWHEDAGNEFYRSREERKVLRRDVDEIRRFVYPPRDPNFDQ